MDDEIQRYIKNEVRTQILNELIKQDDKFEKIKDLIDKISLKVTILLAGFGFVSFIAYIALLVKISH